MNLYIAIILYILSIVAGLFLLASVKTIPKRRFFLLAALHFFFLVIFVLVKLIAYKSLSETNWSFLLFICSGIVLAGLAWRSSVPALLRFYFSAFAFTLILFLFSPSRLMVFLLSGKYTETLGSTFPVRDEYFLEQQNTSSTAFPTYKLIQKHGLFHQAIQRDIQFKGKLDSIRILEFTRGEKTIIRGYSSSITYVSTNTDSADATVPLVKMNQTTIERRF